MASAVDGERDAKVDGRALRYQHRRPELLEAVVEYVLANGIGDLSLRPMAAELGVAHATLLRHFGSKEALVVEVIDRIRADLLQTLAAQVGDLVQVPTADALRAVWRELRRSDQRRQFLLLFEVAAHDARSPGRFGDLTEALVDAFVGPIERNLRHHGRSAKEARELASGFVALVRGVQIDLVISHDLARADATMRHYIDLVAGPSR